MHKRQILAAFFYSNKHKFALILLFLSFFGCFQNEMRYFSKESILVEGVQAEKRVAYFTFDDGPSYLTKEVLAILKEKEVPATFFVIGKQITEETKPLLLQMKEEGHVIGIHTYSHRYQEIYASVDAYVSDAKKTADLIYEATGEKPVYYRFPWGSNNCYATGLCKDIISAMEAEGYIYFDWNVSGGDSVGRPTGQVIQKNIQKDYKRYQEPVILLHDSSINKNTVAVLPYLIDELKEAGYDFATIDKRSTPCQY